MTLERQAEVQKYSGLHSLLLLAYSAAAFVATFSAIFAPWFKLGFLVISLAAALGVWMVLKSNRKHAVAHGNGIYGQSQAPADRIWMLFLPLAVFIAVAGWKIFTLIGDFLFA